MAKKEKKEKTAKKSTDKGGCPLGCKKQCKSKKIKKPVLNARYLCPEGGIYVVAKEAGKDTVKLMVQ